jgi:folate-binding protein YgfZ
MSGHSFGDVTAEYLALRNTAALVENRLDVVWVEGEEVVSFLQGILSQDVAAMTEGAVARTLLLQPNGKLACVAWLFRTTDAVGLVVERGLGADTAKALSRFLIRVNASIRVEDRSVAEVWGPNAGSILTKHGLPNPDGWRDQVVSLPLHHLPRFLVLGDVEWSPALTRAGELAVETVRVEGGEVRNGTDVNERTIPQEAGLVEDAVSFTKGCYLGQELVARIDSRGHVNRHLRGFVVAASVLPPVGANLMSGQKSVGTVSSVTESLTMRSPIGLAMVRREILLGTELRLEWEGGSVLATVTELPFDDFTNP